MKLRVRNLLATIGLVTVCAPAYAQTPPASGGRVQQATGETGNPVGPNVAALKPAIASTVPRIGAVKLVEANTDKAVAFYEKVFEMKVLGRTGREVIMGYDTGAKAPNAPPTAFAGTLLSLNYDPTFVRGEKHWNDIYLMVPDKAVVRQRATDAGFTVTGNPKSFFFNISDPSGNVIEVMDDTFLAPAP